jgi:hypothetical protein
MAGGFEGRSAGAFVGKSVSASLAARPVLAFQLVWRVSRCPSAACWKVEQVGLPGARAARHRRSRPGQEDPAAWSCGGDFGVPQPEGRITGVGSNCGPPSAAARSASRRCVSPSPGHEITRRPPFRNQLRTTLLFSVISTMRWLPAKSANGTTASDPTRGQFNLVAAAELPGDGTRE